MGKSVCRPFRRSTLYCNNNVSPLELYYVNEKSIYTKIVTRTTSCLSFRDFPNLTEVKVLRKKSVFPDVKGCFCEEKPG